MALLLEVVALVNNTDVENINDGSVIAVDKDETLKSVIEAQASLTLSKRSIPFNELFAKK